MAGVSGSVVGLGHDLERVDEQKMQHLLAVADVFFTARELGYLNEKADKVQSACGIFAAKEAMFKALPMLRGLLWTDIEIDHITSGAPQIVVHGSLRAYFDQAGLVANVSITHSHGFASAVVLISEGSFKNACVPPMANQRTESRHKAARFRRQRACQPRSYYRDL